MSWISPVVPWRVQAREGVPGKGWPRRNWTVRVAGCDGGRAVVVMEPVRLDSGGQLLSGVKTGLVCYLGLPWRERRSGTSDWKVSTIWLSRSGSRILTSGRWSCKCVCTDSGTSSPTADCMKSMTG